MTAEIIIMSAPSDCEDSERKRFKDAINRALKEKGGPMTAKEIRGKVKELLGLDREYKRTGYYLTEMVEAEEICRPDPGIYRLP
jgi:hypothetical protein